MLPRLVPEISSLDAFCDGAEEEQEQELGILGVGYVAKQFTQSIWKVFARESRRTGIFGLFVSLKEVILFSVLSRTRYFKNHVNVFQSKTW